MDATARIADEFGRLVALERDGVATRPLAERMVYYIVATRCVIEIDGFTSVYEQVLIPPELELLIAGLEQIGEGALAAEFRRGFVLLTEAGFYDHMNWNKVSAEVKGEIAAIGERVGSALWDLDEKLVALLDGDAPARA